MLLAGCWVVVVMNGVDKALIFLVLITAYIVLGLAETVLLMKRDGSSSSGRRRWPRRRRRGLRRAPRDEEVLRELGAFDDATDEA